MAARRPRDSAGAVSVMGALTAILLVGGVLALALLLGLPGRVAGAAAGGFDRFLRPSTEAAYGEQVILAGRSDRPPVEVRAAAPRRVVSSTPGQHAAPGNVLVGAPVSIHNVGQVMWSSQQGLTVRAEDSAGATYVVRRQVTSTRGAQALPMALSVRPGATARGVVVFEVPRSAHLTRVTITVGTGLTRSGEWSAGD